MTIAAILQLGAEETQTQTLTDYFSLGVGISAVLLLVISLIAYRRTGFKWTLLFSAGFALFAAKTLVQHIDRFFPDTNLPSIELYLTIIDLMVLLLFFLALVKR
jgi:hypothetical protein